ncbi:MAG: phage tail tube protein [Cetobacterium sp.]|uniref:phage tail tube protein n=1 Tax=Cetobacterium sp. TaxID=2071632 RepID=UPI003F3139DD
MANISKNDYFNGNKGQLWLNGKEILTVKKCKVVRKPKYEEIPDGMTGGTRRVLVGHTIEFSGTFIYLGNEDLDLFNESEEVDGVIANTNMAGKVTKRLKLLDMTFDEETLLDFERGKVQEIELSGQAVDSQWLQEK